MLVTETGGLLRGEINTLFPPCGDLSVDVIPIANVLPRQDGVADGRPFVSKIFEEARHTTGIRSDPETGLAIGSAFAASPHTTERLGAAAWTAALETGFDLPAAPQSSLDEAAPHLVTWLRKDGEGVEFTDPAGWSQEVRVRAAALQARELAYLIRTLHAATGEMPTLAQALGYSDESGVGRGGASNPIWHMHAGVVRAVGPEVGEIRQRSEDPEAIAALRSPLDCIVFDRYAETVARVFNRALGGGKDFADVTPMLGESADNMFSYYQAVFDQEVPLQNVIEAVMQATGPLEVMYAKLREYHKSFYTSLYMQMHAKDRPGEEGARTLAEKERLIAAEGLNGFDVREAEAESMLALVEKIRPTYRQLLLWQAELATDGRDLTGSLLQRKIDQYENFMNTEQGQRKRSPLLQRLLEDAALPEGDTDRRPTALVSGRPSFFFAISPESYELYGEGAEQCVYVNEVKLGTCLSTQRMMMEVYTRAKLVRS